MKIINENLEMVDYEEKDRKYEAKLNCKMAADIALLELIHDMNRNTCHKINFILIGTQFLIIVASLILQLIFQEFKIIISITGATASIVMMFLVLINTKLSNKALKEAHKQREAISGCMTVLIKDE